MTDSIRIGYIGGRTIPGNVRRFLENLRGVLDSRPTSLEHELVAGEGVPRLRGFDHVDPGIPETGTARGTLLGLTRAIRSYARSHRPDVLFQVTRFPTHGTATAVAARLTGTPAITRLAGDNFNEHRFANDVEERLRTFLLKNCIGIVPVHLPDAVVVLGPRGRSQLRRRLRRRSVYQIPQPVDTDRFSPVGRTERSRVRSVLGMPELDEERVLLTVGRLSRRKGIPDLRAVARHLADEGLSVTWYVVGEGPMDESLSGVPSVEHVGPVPHEDIVDYYRAADLYVHPALHEGLPNTLLESTACGTPAVARDVGECGEVAVATFTDRPGLRRLLRERYDRVELDERFSPERLGQRYEELLLEVAS